MLEASQILERKVSVNRGQRCIYFLIDGDQIVYVGQSGDGPTRVASHRAERKKSFTHFFILPAPTENLNELEALYIHKFKPKYNKSLPVQRLVCTFADYVVWRCLRGSTIQKEVIDNGIERTQIWLTSDLDKIFLKQQIQTVSTL